MDTADKTQPLRAKLAKLITDTMGKDSGELYYDFYKYDDAESVTIGARALLEVFLGPDMADKKINQILEEHHGQET